MTGIGFWLAVFGSGFLIIVFIFSELSRFIDNFGAGNGIQTRDLRLGKAAQYRARSFAKSALFCDYWRDFNKIDTNPWISVSSIFSHFKTKFGSLRQWIFGCEVTRG